MATAYKILGQIQGISAASQQNLNLYPDPNMERYGSDTSASNPGTLGIWYQGTWTDGSVHTEYLTSGGQGSDLAGKTNWTRTRMHANHSGQDAYWSLKPAMRPYLDPSKTYTLSFWYKHWNDNNSYHHGGGQSYHSIGYGKNNESQGGVNVQAGNGSHGQHDTGAWNNWKQHYATFVGTGSYFSLNVRNHGHYSGTTYYNGIDNVYLAEGAIPLALIPSKAPDGSTGNPNALYTAPFTVRSEGWAGTANESATVRKLTGAWQTLYSVPDVDGTNAVCSTLSISNMAPSSATYRVAVQKSGESLTAKHIVAFDTPIVGNGVDSLTLGMTLGRSDKILVQSDSDKVNFSLFGSENSI